MTVHMGKELRALWPAWWVAAGLAGLPLLSWPLVPGWPQPSFALWLVLFYVGCLLLGMEVLGLEFSHRTFGLLLVQPVSRRRLWWLKMRALGVAVASTTAIHGVTSVLGQGDGVELPSLPEWVLLWAVVVVGAVGFSLFLSLVLREVSAAFWLAALLPPALLGCIGALVKRVFGPDLAFESGMAIVGGAGLVGWILAYRQFIGAEDAAPLAAEVHLSLGRARRGRTPLGVQSPRAWGAALRAKELRLHQLPLLVSVLVGGLALVALVVQAVPSDSGLLDAFVPGWFVWPIVPFLVGALAVAEERRLGVHVGQRALPISWGRQWRIKLGCTYGVSFVLGVVVPMGVGLLGALGNGVGEPAGAVRRWLASASITWAVGTTVGLYASSLGRNLMQALSIAVGLALAFIVALVSAGVVWRDWQPSPVQLGMVVAGVVFVPCLLWRAGVHARVSDIDGRVLRREVGVLALGLAAVQGLTAAIYTRAWDYVRPVPPVSSPLVHKPGVTPKIVRGSGVLVVLTLDGRLWRLRQVRQASGRFALERPTLLSQRAEWLDVAADVEEVWAVRDDGTLWSWHTGQSWTVHGEAGAATWTPPEESAAQQVGPDSRWRAVAGNVDHLVALRSDGTLWGRGRSDRGQLGVMPALPASAAMPMRHGLGVISEAERDGLSGTRYGPRSGAETTVAELPGSVGPGARRVVTVVSRGSAPAPLVPPITNLVQLPGGTNAVAVSAGPLSTLAVRTDGTPRVWGVSQFRRDGPQKGEGAMLDLAGTNWVRLVESEWLGGGWKTDGSFEVWWTHPGVGCVAGMEGQRGRADAGRLKAICLAEGRRGMDVLTVGAEGSLGRWTGRRAWPGPPRLLGDATEREPVSARSDWVALESNWLGLTVGGLGTVVGLTGDGRLWTLGESSWVPWVSASQQPRQVAVLRPAGG